MDAKTRQPRRDTRTLQQRLDTPIAKMSMKPWHRRLFKEADARTAKDVYPLAYGHTRSRLRFKTLAGGLNALRKLRIPDFGPDLTQALVDDAVAAERCRLNAHFQFELAKLGETHGQETARFAIALGIDEDRILELERDVTILRRALKRGSTTFARMDSAIIAVNALRWLADCAAEERRPEDMKMSFSVTLTFNTRFGKICVEGRCTISGADIARTERNLHRRTKGWHRCFAKVSFAWGGNPVEEIAMVSIKFRSLKVGPAFPALSGACVFPGISDETIDRMLGQHDEPEAGLGSAAIPLAMPPFVLVKRAGNGADHASLATVLASLAIVLAGPRSPAQAAMARLVSEPD